MMGPIIDQTLSLQKTRWDGLTGAPTIGGIRSRPRRDGSSADLLSIAGGTAHLLLRPLAGPKGIAIPSLP